MDNVESLTHRVLHKLRRGQVEERWSQYKPSDEEKADPSLYAANVQGEQVHRVCVCDCVWRVVLVVSPSVRVN